MAQEEITGTNCIICGDCKDQLGRIPDESVDLIYLDPPFFSGKDYEIIWKDGEEIRSFTDTEFYTLICECGKVFPDKNKFCADCGAPRDKANERKSKDIEAYLQWIRPRLEECKRVLSETGSIYCHLDWHAVHYVKVMMDEIFGYKNFKNEIIWNYNWASNVKKNFAKKHDNILFYTKSSKWNFNMDSVRIPYTETQLKGYKKDNVGYYTFDKRRNKKYYAHTIGQTAGDVFDIGIISRSAKERLGYPTQKPEALLERIIKASSNPGDIVLDPFCGCGTAIATAQKLGRRWIGIDVSPTSTRLMVKRLRDIKGDWVQITEADIIDLPRTCAELRKMNPFEFQNLVISKLDGKQNPKKVDDHGIDGWTYKRDDHGMGYKTGGLDAAVQVKRQNKAGRPDINKLVGAMTTDPNTDGKHGIIIAFDFPKTAKTEVENLKTKAGITIELITVKELFGCE